MKTLLLLFVFSILSVCASAQQIGSCHIFPSNNPWNVRVDTLPVDTVHSAAYIASVGGSIHVHPDFGSNASYGIPWIAVSGSQAFVPIDLSNGYTDQSDPGPMPIPSNAPVEQPAPPGGDGHVLVIDTGNHHLYELYQGIKSSGTGWAATSSAVFGLDSNNYRPDGWTSCDAAGLPIFPGLVRLDECKAGAINHALRFTIGGKNTNGSFKNISQKGWIFPARHEAGGTSDTMAMPMGLRLRLKASFNDSNDTGYAKVIITALKKYGIILADNGSPWYISGENNTQWPDDDISQLKAITGSDFEAVYTGPVRTSANQYPDPILPILGNIASIALPSFDDDTVRVGDANTISIPIANTGSAPLTIDRYWLKYGVFFQIADSGIHSISAGGSGHVDINFTPHLKGLVLDTLFIASSDASAPTKAVVLRGFGTAGIFHVSANPLSFGTVQVGKSDTMWIVLNDLGDGELDVYANSRTGTSPDFTIVALGPQTTPPLSFFPGDTEIVGIQFAPTIVGNDTSIFSFSFADTLDEIHDTTLTMVGVGAASSSVSSETSTSFDLNLFPNPTSGSITISETGMIMPTNIEITDQLGRNIRNEVIQTQSKVLDLSRLANGCYVLHAQSPFGTINKLLEIVR